MAKKEQSQSRSERTGETPSNKNKNLTSSPPGISNIFKNTYNPETIKMDFPADSGSQQEAAANTGFLPFVWYNSYQISYGDIQYLLLSHDGVVPIIKMIFTDSVNLMKDKGMPLDDSKIKVFINPRSPKLKPILLQFKISYFKVNGGTYTMAGILDIDKLYLKQFKSYKSMTSIEALKEIMREMGLGFNSNVDNTSDSMTWINTGQRMYSFIMDIIETSYKSDEAFILGYIDYYYHFNYVDLEKELSRNVKEELGISSFGLEQAADIKDKDKLASLFLTNDKTHENSNTHISKYKIINNSTTVSLLEGYLTRVKYYDDMNKDLLVFDVDSITTKGDKIILKGAPQNEEFFNKNINLKYVGKLDGDNAHKNYNYSYVQNVRNISDLEKIQLNVELSTPNFNIYRFQKLQVILTNNPTPSQAGFNNRLSGEWFVANIKFELNRGKFIQKIQLVKRDLELSPEEINQEASKGETQTQTQQNVPSETTTNPEDLTNTDVDPPQPLDPPKKRPVKSLIRKIANKALYNLDYIIGDTSRLRDNNQDSLTLVAIDGSAVAEGTAVAYMKMKDDAKSEGVILSVVSGFRPAYGPRVTARTKSGQTITVTTQEYLYDGWVARKAGFNLAAPPGSSNHGYGIAIDLNTGSRKKGSLNSKVYIWLVKNSWKYGFIRGVGKEEWHYEYRPDISGYGPYAKIKDGQYNLYYPELGISGLDVEKLA